MLMSDDFLNPYINYTCLQQVQTEGHECWYVKVRVLVKNFRSLDLAWLHLTAFVQGTAMKHLNCLCRLSWSSSPFSPIFHFMSVGVHKCGKDPFQLYRPLVLGSVSSSSWKCSKNSSNLPALLNSMKTKLKRRNTSIAITYLKKEKSKALPKSIKKKKSSEG